MVETYNTLVREGQAEFKDRGSRFLAFAFPMLHADIFKKQLQHLKAAHPKANHHCFAWRLGTNGNSFRVSDDGEPSGSAGRPILGQLDSRGITNAGIVIVRYFGGTLLGVPGLINAYKTAATLALQVAPVEVKMIERHLKISCTYHDMNDVMRIVKLCNGQVLTNDQGLFSTLTVSIPVNRIEQATLQLSGLFQVQYSILQTT